MKLFDRALLGVVGSLAMLASSNIFAASSDYALTPPATSASETPLVMLGMSVDHQLFYKAYPDYSDIDGDGVVDSGYDDSIEYYGYFHSNWCYSYDTTNNRYSPEEEITSSSDHKCDSTVTNASHTSNTYWSGNFLNWATMTRMDVVRRILFGGKRSTDTSSLTVLERAYIPRDNHAFAKVFESSEINSYTPYANTLTSITICNVSASSATSPSNAPLARVARGSFRRWSADENIQCQWNGNTNAPSATTDKLADGLTVKVEACVSGKDADDATTNCKTYGSSSKPVGVLQNYGEEGALRFGLISGSYDKKISGGVLRRNISQIAGNTSASDDEINLADGTFNSSVNGIISNINSFRILNWDGSKYSDCSTHSIDVNTFKTSAASNRQCKSWGNPVSEIYLEALRYFAGAGSASSAYSLTSDSLGTIESSWSDPLSSTNACADCSIIMFSSGASSFDGDELSSSTDISGLTSLTTLTNDVGDLEYGGSFSGDYIIGENSTSSSTEDGLCSSKTLGNLAEALGICPEVPLLEGTYHIAGLAYHANTDGVRTISTTDGNIDKTITTYAVELAESLPTFNINYKAGGVDKTISFSPACLAKAGSNPELTCSLIDVETFTETDDGNGNVKGRFIIHWEDSPWGNDYDEDGAQIIWYCTGSACDNADNASWANWDDALGSGEEVRITTGVAYANAGNQLRFSYSVSGSSSDGIQSSWLTRTGNVNQTTFWDGSGTPPSQSKSSYPPVSSTYSSGTSSAVALEKPLWMAAKYGGFIDSGSKNGDPTPDSGTSTSEWDSIDNRTGQHPADGIPDNYYLMANPALLEQQLGVIFNTLISRASAGSNAAVVANSSTGVGAIYQAYYQPSMIDGAEEVTWIGDLRALFIDSKGNLREDTDADGVLDDYSTDLIIRLDYDSASDETKVKRYQSTDGTYDLVSDLVGTDDLIDMKAIWSASDELNKVTDPATQRTYTSADSGQKRYIFTAVDKNTDSELDQNDVLAFTTTNLGSSTSLYHYLGVSSSQADALIDYIRGKEDSSYRNRTINGETFRLGDIIHSAPAVVGAPQDGYDFTDSDSTYSAFRAQYANRRNMIYAGANDGMLHAFNAGFWDAAANAFNLTNSSSSATSYNLGQELWAYVPGNLLPHLQWLGETNYPHVYYVDGAPIVFDANIFPTDADHPHGWGTVLVVGMRMGGGPIDATVIDADNDGTPETDKTFRSAYLVFDVTNPEQAPVLLGELTHPNLGQTTSVPEVVKFRSPDSTGDFSNPTVNKWYLVFGSGPYDGASYPSSVTSTQTAKIFAVDLSQLVTNSDSATPSGTDHFVSGFAPYDTSISSAFVGGFDVADWDSDLNDDIVYFGTVEGTVASPGGRLMRVKLNSSTSSWTVNTLLQNVGLAISAPPLAAKGESGNRWVTVGTGRLWATDDNDTSDQNYLLGVREPINSSNDYSYPDHASVSSYSLSGLLDMSDIAVYDDGSSKQVLTTNGGTVTISGNTVETYPGLVTALGSESGWKVELKDTGADPSGRAIFSAVQNPANKAEVAYIEYLPASEQCEVNGESYLWIVGIETGTATPANALDSKTTVGTDNYHNTNALVADGLAFGPSFHQGEDGLKALYSTSTAAHGDYDVNTGENTIGRQSWRQIDTSNF
ncbi:pilus assembly protein [Hahella ganghwensis]|uniref:pilus assembly protein n=1 Tax=Hahella ganghwensis TaxID=286420 RepID=UPI000375C1D5|nr:PilC/PilY family type IV pilus protein [Hahella ganghwensis]